MERQLTKEERELYRSVTKEAMLNHQATLVDYRLTYALDDLDAADAEIADNKRLIEGYESVIVAQRKEIARLTTAFEECDRREREAQEALKAMRDENKRLKRLVAFFAKPFVAELESIKSTYPEIFEERFEPLIRRLVDKFEERGDAD